MTVPVVHPDALILADLLRAEWPAARERIRLGGHPTCEGDPDADPAPDQKLDPDPADPAPDPKPDLGTDADPIKPEDDWKAKARKWERDAKREREAREAAEAKIAEAETAKMTEQEQAIAKAREEATDEVASKYEQDLRAERMEHAVTRLAVAQGVTIGEGDKAKTVKFADADDVQMWLERKIKSGDIDADDIYHDGKVDKDALTDALIDLAKAKPSWLAETPAAAAKRVDIDARKGAGPGAKSLEEMTPDDHLKEVQASRR